MYIPHCPQLTFFIKTPNIFHLISDFVSEYLSGGTTHVLIPSRKDDLISLQFGPISEQQAMRLDLSDLLALLDFDLAINDELTGSNVDAV